MFKTWSSLPCADLLLQEKWHSTKSHTDQTRFLFLACLGSRVTFHVSSVCSLNRMSVCQWSKSALPLPPPAAHHGRCPLPLLLLCHMSGALIKKLASKLRNSVSQNTLQKRLISLISSHQVKKKQLRSIFVEVDLPIIWHKLPWKTPFVWEDFGEDFYPAKFKICLLFFAGLLSIPGVSSPRIRCCNRHTWSWACWQMEATEENWSRFSWVFQMLNGAKEP